MTSVWMAALFAVFVWWFSTGAILMLVKYADHRGAGTRVAAVLASIPVLVAGALVYMATLESGTTASRYGAFLAAIAIWGWFELAFLAGIITGPVNRPCPPGVPPWERFLRAWGTIAYSEMALLAALVAMVWVGWNAENGVGMWTFVVLFFARVSAKLNLFFGVANVNMEFLPDRMKHLPSHFTIAPMNWVFPFSITALTLATGCWLERAYSVTGADRIGFVLLAAITALALIEHWLMIVRVGEERLWRWFVAWTDSRRQRNRRTDHRPLGEDLHGL